MTPESRQAHEQLVTHKQIDAVNAANNVLLPQGHNETKRRLASGDNLRIYGIAQWSNR